MRRVICYRIKILFLSTLIVSGGLTARTAEQSILLEQDLDVALSGSDILKTVPVDFALQYRAWLHALIVQKGVLCKGQRKELQQFCRSVQRSSLPLATQRELVVPLKQLVKHTRRNWIVGLSLVGGMLATVGILCALKKSQFKSTDFVSTPGLINDDDIMNGSALGSGILTESGVRTPVGSWVESPSTPLRAAQKVLGPPGGSPGQGVVSKDWCSNIDGWYLDWQKFLNSKTIKRRQDSFFSNGLRMLMAAYEERVLTKELYDFIIELCFTYDNTITITRLKENEEFKTCVVRVYEMYKHVRVGKLLLRTIQHAS
jgi:hypothetical protein